MNVKLPRLVARVIFRRWLPEFVGPGRQRIRRQLRILGLSMLVGLVAGLGAIFFYAATRAVAHYSLDVACGYHAEPHPAGEPVLRSMPDTDTKLVPWLLVLVPTVGGLMSGILVYSLAPEAEGHGTDSVIAAYHQHQGYLRPRVPLVKIVASALTIGTGGSGGREGPIAQIGAGFGSMLAGLIGLRPNERRVLLAAGMGAGIAAIFRAPLAGALFAAEVLYWSPEFEPEVILPAALASVTAYCTYGSVFGWQPLFATPPLTFSNPWQLIPYLVLALFMALLAMIYTRTFYGVTAVFHRWRIRPHLKPAVGALATGLIGVALYYLFARDEAVLAVMSFGYNAIQSALSERDVSTAWLLLAIALGKILTTSLTIGSGGSGGVFGPSMVIGGCGGGALGLLLHHYWPNLVDHPASFVLVGMAGFFAAAAKTPFSTLVITSEMTGGYDLLLPTLWVCTIAFMFSDAQSIYSSQVEGRSRSPAHQGVFVRQMLAPYRVEEFLRVDPDNATLRAGDSLGTVLAHFDAHSDGVLPVVNEERALLGVVSLEEVYLASHTPELLRLILVADLMRDEVAPLVPEDSLEQALALFVENELPALPVVDSHETKKVLGMARRVDVVSAYLRLLHPPRATDERTA